MPGLLKPDAQCPKCQTPLVAVMRAQNAEGLTVEYFHEKGWDGRDQISLKARRKLRCKVFYADPSTAPDLDQHRSAA